MFKIKCNSPILLAHAEPDRSTLFGKMISVGVFIDLKWQQSAGGHVKCWERFAKAAISQPDLDLTLHFLGDTPQTIDVSEHVRYRLHPPCFSTERLPFLEDVPDHTDLVGFNPLLLPYLETIDVAHTTHPLFTFGKTAQTFCQQQNKPLVTSIHTDTPHYTQIYLEQRLRRLWGDGLMSQLLIDHLQLPHRYRRRMVAQQQRYWQTCNHVLMAQPEDPEVTAVMPKVKVSHLRRGIDTQRFNPTQRDRTVLYENYGIPSDCFLLLYVGRLDDCKSVMTCAHSTKILIDQGLPIHLLAVGRGNRSSDIQQLLQGRVTLPGVIEQDKLGAIFASADLFVFPSQTEGNCNVVLEAKSSGLPVITSAQGGASQSTQVSGEDGMILETDAPQQWADAIAQLYHNGEMRSQIAQAGQHRIQQVWPSWQDVLIEDLLPVWQSLAHAKAS
ncbi:MAG: glycosyltransferase [Thermosynechococcaceae cyanobacterium]